MDPKAWSHVEAEVNVVVGRLCGGSDEFRCKMKVRAGSNAELHGSDGCLEDCKEFHHDRAPTILVRAFRSTMAPTPSWHSLRRWSVEMDGQICPDCGVSLVEAPEASVAPCGGADGALAEARPLGLFWAALFLTGKGVGCGLDAGQVPNFLGGFVQWPCFPGPNEELVRSAVRLSEWLLLWSFACSSSRPSLVGSSHPQCSGKLRLWRKRASRVHSMAVA